MKKIYLAALSTLIAFASFSQESEKALTLSGYVDTYYFANFNGSQSNLGVSGFERIFDQKANNFQVGLAQLKTTYSKGKVTGVIDLTFGNHGDLGNYENVQSPIGVGIGSTALAIKQAYMSYAFTDKVSLTAGQFGTNVGYEVIDAPANFNYSLSNLFGNGPFYHTGIKMDVAASDKVGLMLGINNGLDSKDDQNKSKGIMAQVSLAPVEAWSIYLNYFGSNEQDIDAGEKSMYTWYDITTSYQVNDNFLVGLNAVPYGALKVGSADPQTWWGAALYLNGSISEKFGLGVRAEHFDNKDAGIYLTDVDGNGSAVTSLTLTGNVTLSENLMFKPELRFDTYSPTIGFQLKDGKGAGVNSQTTIGGAMIFHF